MGFYVVQSGSELYRVDTAGVATQLTVPDGVTIDPTRRLRAAVLNRQIVLVNSPSENLWLDPYGTLRTLTLKPPVSRPVLAATGTGSLNGAYRARQSFILRDPNTGAVINESGLGPISKESGTLTDDQLLVTGIEKATQAISARRLYRTTSGPGAEYFSWIDADGNEITSLSDGLADEELSLISAPEDLGPAPGKFELIVEWKDRLWAKSLGDIDAVSFSGNRKFYGWPEANSVPIKPVGNDLRGVTGFLPRRDELGIARKGIVWKLIGDPPDVSLIKLVEGTGVEAPDSIVVIRDVAYWLGKDGIYRWGPDGVVCLSDLKLVRSWFATDTYFNRSRFEHAFARYNQRYHAYELHLAAAGETTESRWILYDIKHDLFLGPHRTVAFTPTHTGVFEDANENTIPVIGSSDGFIWKMNQAGASDGGTAIDLDCELRHWCKTPDIDKVFGQMSILTKEEAGGALTITPALGTIDAADQAAISHDLTKERERLRRISTATQEVGRTLKLRLRQNTNAQDVHIYGYEIPFFETGRR